jgi:hypothetical protein
LSVIVALAKIQHPIHFGHRASKLVPQNKKWNPVDQNIDRAGGEP